MLVRKSVYMVIMMALTLVNTSILAGDIRMYLDVARFRYDEQQTYVEIYYLLYELPEENMPPTEDVWLQFQLWDDEKQAMLTTSDLKVTMDHTRTTAAADSEAFVKGSVIKTVLQPGKYRIKMFRLAEAGGAAVDSVDYTFATSPFQTERISLSDLELCSNIIQNSARTKGVFYKNGMEVFPNPMHLYGEQTPEVHYYVELYNLKSDTPDDKLRIEVAVVDPKGNILRQKNYNRNRQYESLAECGFFDVSDLSSGLYTVVFAVKDENSNYSVYTRDNFYVMNPGIISDADQERMIAFAQSPFFNMPEAEVDEKFEQIRYISTKELENIYKSLDSVEKKRDLLFKFWYQQEKEHPGLREEYYERVAYANEFYAFANVPGWKSDRGRVYIVYGKPTRVEQFPNGPNHRPFEIWYYDQLEGGSRFYFVDNTGFGDYRLVTSTYRGEVYDPGWEEQIQDWLRYNPSYDADIY